MRLYLPLILRLLLTACTPEPQPTPIPDPDPDPNENPIQTFEVNIFNTDTVALNYRLYHSLSDLQNNTNAFLSLRLNPAQLRTATITLHDTGHYYADVYSDDYTITNWPNTHVARQNDLLNPQSYIDIMQIKNVSRVRNYFLNGSGTESHWRAIDITDSSGSIWSALNNNERYLRLTIRRNGYYTLVTKDANGTETVVERTSSVSGIAGVAPQGIDLETGIPFGELIVGTIDLLHPDFIEFTTDTASLADSRTQYHRIIRLVKE